ncbi:MAG: hypothetical protein ABW060_04880 [Solirubrobacteraceae bacterium]
MTDLTAIDILIDPDDAMIARAKAVNATMLGSIPSGFALDEHHRPHITTLQRYVRTAELDDVFGAVRGVLASVDVGSLELTAVAVRHMVSAATPGVGLAGIVVQPAPAVLDFQAKLIDAVRPFTGSGGTADAYVRTDAEPDINQDTLEYIEHYVPDHSGEKFLGHVTVGLAKLDDLAAIEAEPFEPLTFSPAGISVYQLGNNGTAAKHLQSFVVS